MKNRILTATRVLSLISMFVLSGAGLCNAQEPTSENLQKVILQLGDSHSFKFAGYYVALEKGFYRNLGLDVEIRELMAQQDVVQEIVSGRALFGVKDSRLLLDFSRGKNVVVLAHIFQQPTKVVIVPTDSEIKQLEDLQGKRIYWPTVYGAPAIDVMLAEAGITANDIIKNFRQINDPDSYTELEKGNFDALVVEHGEVAIRYPDYQQRFRVFYPESSSIDLYGDCLFTTQKHIVANHQIVKNFRDATFQGWRYVLAAEQETAAIVKSSFCPDQPLGKLPYQGHQLISDHNGKSVELGHVQQSRWENAQEVLLKLGWLDSKIDLDTFIFDEKMEFGPKLTAANYLHRYLPWIILAVVFIGFVHWVAYLFHKIALAKSGLNMKDDAVNGDESADSQKTEVNVSSIIERNNSTYGSALWDWDVKTNVLTLADLFKDLTGYGTNELGAGPEGILKICHPDDVPHVRRTFISFLKRDTDDCILEFRLLCKNGDYCWISSQAAATWSDTGDPLRVVGSFTDITGRVEAEQERDRLFNLSIDMMAVGGFDGFLQQLNPAWVRILGWSRDDIMGHPILFFVHPEDQQITAEALEMLETGQPVDGLENRFRCRDGSYRWLSWSSFPYPDRKLVFSVVRDITEKKQAERKLLEYQDRLRSLTNQLALVEDRQRRQLAEAIHDGLAQQLFGIRAKVTLLKYPKELENLLESVEEILSIIDDTMVEARSLSFELFPPVLYEVGLDAALTWLAHHVGQRTGVICELTSEGEEFELVPDMRAMAYQCVRELLANVYKHADATKVGITLNHVDDFLTILVEDDGKGFLVRGPEAVQSEMGATTGFGLFSIRERLRSVGGRMLVDSRPGAGCRVFLSFPVNKPEVE